MILRYLTGMTMMLALLLAGCTRPDKPADNKNTGPDTNKPAAVAETQLHLDHAQSGLPVTKLWVGAEEINVEICTQPQQLATGMMFRTNMAENAGMLFAFAMPHRTGFYMKNTTLPLTAAYISPDGVILELHDLKPLDLTPVDAASDQVQLVLEMNQGWFARHNVPTGVVVRFPSGTLQGSFTRSR